MDPTTREWGSDLTPVESLELKLQLLRDRVTAVVRGLQTGLYVYGAGGTGKTHTVVDQLCRLGADYRQFNARMTGKGLFAALKAGPDAVHVLEDMERLTDDRDAQGVLRGALWPTPGRDRRVTWSTAGGTDEFVFRGGVILLANRPLANLPELRALATRIAVYRLEVTGEEMLAQVRRLADVGYRRDGRLVLPPDECGEVIGRLIAECRRAGCPLDLRLLFNAYHDFLLWDGHHAACHWHDLVASRVREAATAFEHPPEPRTAEEKKAWARQVVREVMALHPDDKGEQMREYCRRTKKSKADFYRRKGEVECGEFDGEPPAPTAD
ncbi:MAG: hypothetical protein U0871_04730 [Gemmataceae bacterium]